MDMNGALARPAVIGGVRREHQEAGRITECALNGIGKRRGET